MRRREISSLLLGAASIGAISAMKPANAQSCVAPCYARTTAEISAGVVPIDATQLPGDIRRYGAVPDNATDCSTAIGAALSVGAAGGGPMLVPEGTFAFGTTIVPRSGVNIVGVGKQKSILRYSGSTLAIDARGTSGARIIFRMENISIGMTNTANTADGIKLAWNQRSQPLLRDVELYNFGNHGLVFAGDNWIVGFEDVEIHDCGRNGTNKSGIYKDPAVQELLDITFDRLLLEACGSTSSAAGGIFVGTTLPYSVKGLVIRDSCIEGNFGTEDVYLYNCDNLVFDGNYVEIAISGSSRSAVELQGCNATFSNNRVSSDAGNSSGKALIVNGGRAAVTSNTFDTDFGGGDIALINGAACNVSDRNGTNRLSHDSTSTIVGGGMSVAAWARFNGSTGALEAGYNVASVTRASTGSYSLTFRVAMPNTKYLVTGSAENGALYTGLILSPGYVSSASSCAVSVIDPAGVLRDGRQVSVVVMSEFAA